MARWEANHRSRDFQKMMTGREMDTAVRGIARQLGATYRRLAPVNSGRLKSSVRVRTETAQLPSKFGPQTRRVGVVEVTAPYAAAVEFGTKGAGRRGKGVMKRALGAMG